MPISGGNRWTDFVREYARKNSISYMCALSTPDCSASYKSGKQGEPKTKKEKKAREMMEAEDRPAPDRKKGLGDIFESATPISGSIPPEQRKQLIKSKKGALQKALEDKQREHAQMGAEDRDAPEAPKSKAKKARKPAGRPRKYATVEEARIANIKQTAERKKAKTQARVGKGRKTATVSASFSRPYNADVGDPNPLSGGVMSGGMPNPFDFGYKLGHDVIGPALFGRGMMSGGDFLSAVKGIGHALGKPYEAIPIEKMFGLGRSGGKGFNPFDLGYKLGHDVIGPALLGRGLSGGDWLSAIKGIGHAIGKPYEAIPLEKLVGLGMSGGMDMPSLFDDDDDAPAGPAYPAPPVPPAPALTQAQLQQLQQYLMTLMGTPSRIPRKQPPKKRGGMVNPFAESHAIIAPAPQKPEYHILPYPPRSRPVREAPNIRPLLGSDPRTYSPTGGSVFGDYSSLIKHLVGHITDPNEPIDPKDFAGAKKLITGIQKVKKVKQAKGGVRIGPVPKNTFVGMNQYEIN